MNIRSLDLPTFRFKFTDCTNASNFHPFEVVGRGSDTQLQVGENLNNITLQIYTDLAAKRLTANRPVSRLHPLNRGIKLSDISDPRVALGCLRRAPPAFEMQSFLSRHLSLHRCATTRLRAWNPYGFPAASDNQENTARLFWVRVIFSASGLCHVGCSVRSPG